MNKEKKLFTSKEAAYYLGTSCQTLYSWKRSGKLQLPFVAWGRRGLRFSKDAIDQWIDDNSYTILPRETHNEY